LVNYASSRTGASYYAWLRQGRNSQWIVSLKILRLLAVACGCGRDLAPLTLYSSIFCSCILLVTIHVFGSREMLLLALFVALANAVTFELTPSSLQVANQTTTAIGTGTSTSVSTTSPSLSPKATLLTTSTSAVPATVQALITATPASGCGGCSLFGGEVQVYQ
jgi:hypothetical protein